MPMDRTERSENERGCISPVANSAATSPARTAPAHPPRGRYGGESPDYESYRYGYPPFSGRMFGSGN